MIANASCVAGNTSVRHPAKASLPRPNPRHDVCLPRQRTNEPLRGDNPQILFGPQASKHRRTNPLSPDARRGSRENERQAPARRAACAHCPHTDPRSAGFTLSEDTDPSCPPCPCCGSGYCPYGGRVLRHHRCSPPSHVLLRGLLPECRSAPQLSTLQRASRSSRPCLCRITRRSRPSRRLLGISTAIQSGPTTPSQAVTRRGNPAAR